MSMFGSCVCGEKDCYNNRWPSYTTWQYHL